MDNFTLTALRKLYDEELYEDAILVASLMHSSCNNTTPAETEYQIVLIEANSHYYERKFRLAVLSYLQVIALRKTLIKAKNPNYAAVENSSEHFSEVETRYRLAKCYQELREMFNGVRVLEVIPSKARPAKVNLLLARLLHHCKETCTNDSIAVYKEVLWSCPLSLSTSRTLLDIGVDLIQVHSLIVSACANTKSMEWLNLWVKGHAQMFNREHAEAAKTFRLILDLPKLHQNVHILSLVGHAYFYNGNNDQAYQYLHSAHMIKPHLKEPIMPLAVILTKKNLLMELETLASIPQTPAEFSSENWFVLAQCLCANRKLEKASYFTHKAIAMDARNMEASLLRGKIFLELKRYSDAIPYFRTVLNFANYRFEVYKGLFAAYVGMKRKSEALNMAQLGTEHFGNQPRSYVLLARTLMGSSSQSSKRQVKANIIKAIELDEYYFPAVALLAEVLLAEGDTGRAVTVLKKQINSHPNCKLFTMLGDIMRSEKDLDGALEYYTAALSLDATYQKALDGINAIGQSSRFSKQDDSIGDTCSKDEDWITTDAMGNREVESESETVWSDMEAELTA